MGKGIFEGVNGVARQTTKAHLGVSAVAREVTNGFIGVNSVAREFWDGGWKFEFVDDNDGLASYALRDIGTAYPKFVLKTGTSTSAASFKISGDIAGKTCVIDGYRDTDGNGYLRINTDGGSTIKSFAWTDDVVDGSDTYTPSETSGASCFVMFASGGTSSKSRSSVLTKLMVGDVNVLEKLIDWCLTTGIEGLTAINNFAVFSGSGFPFGAYKYSNPGASITGSISVNSSNLAMVSPGLLGDVYGVVGVSENLSCPSFYIPTTEFKKYIRAYSQIRVSGTMTKTTTPITITLGMYIDEDTYINYQEEFVSVSSFTVYWDFDEDLVECMTKAVGNNARFYLGAYSRIDEGDGYQKYYCEQTVYFTSMYLVSN